MAEEFLAKDLQMELLPFLVGPRRIMHAIGDMSDVELFGQMSLIKEAEHLAADASVDGTHAIDFLRQLAGQNAHGEFAVYVVDVFATQTHERRPVEVVSLSIV